MNEQEVVDVEEIEEVMEMEITESKLSKLKAKAGKFWGKSKPYVLTAIATGVVTVIGVKLLGGKSESNEFEFEDDEYTDLIDMEEADEVSEPVTFIEDSEENETVD